MRASTRRELVAGPAGRIECAVDRPESTPRGVALVAHPHPLFGGTLDNKVVQTLARAFLELGYETWRANFRGVGQTEGAHDEGHGVQVLQLAAAQLAQRVTPERLVLVGIGVTRLKAPAVPADTLVIHGENDETVPLAAVLDWARPQELPVVLVPGADHFFHRKLHVLRAIVSSNWK